MRTRSQRSQQPAASWPAAPSAVALPSHISAETTNAESSSQSDVFAEASLLPTSRQVYVRDGPHADEFVPSDMNATPLVTEASLLRDPAWREWNGQEMLRHRLPPLLCTPLPTPDDFPAVLRPLLGAWHCDASPTLNQLRICQLQVLADYTLEEVVITCQGIHRKETTMAHQAAAASAASAANPVASATASAAAASQRPCLVLSKFATITERGGVCRWTAAVHSAQTRADLDLPVDQFTTQDFARSFRSSRALSRLVRDNQTPAFFMKYQAQQRDELRWTGLDRAVWSRSIVAAGGRCFAFNPRTNQLDESDGTDVMKWDRGFAADISAYERHTVPQG